MNIHETVKNYKTNYLTNVIFKIDYPKILDLDIREPTAEFQKKIFEEFPIMSEIDRQNVKVKLKSSKVHATKDKEILWKFTNKKDTKAVFIGSETLSIEYSDYENFNELSQDFNRVFLAFRELYPVAIAKRVGLRYINEIKIDEGHAFDLEKYINKNLCSITNQFLSENDKPLRSMHLLELKENEYNFKFQYGMFNSGYPNPIASKEFVLDYDCSIKDVDINEIFSILQDSNKLIYKWFEKSIEDGLREKMGVLDG